MLIKIRVEFERPNVDLELKKKLRQELKNAIRTVPLNYSNVTVSYEANIDEAESDRG